MFVKLIFRLYIIKDYIVEIGNKTITFPSETVIKNLIQLKESVCFFTYPKSNDLDWNKRETSQIWDDRCKNNPSELYCYLKDGTLKWTFEKDNIAGYSLVVPEQEKEEDFITPEHYKRYMERFAGKELLEIYAGDYQYIVDADTGKIYYETYTR